MSQVFQYTPNPSGPMAGITLPSDDELEKMLSRVRIKFFGKGGNPFLAALMCKIPVIWSTALPTAATDGLKIWWNPYFFISIPQPEQIFVLAHELWHVAYLHALRRGNRDPKKWNIAADHVINTMLIQDGYSVANLGFDILRDMKYFGWSVDRVYDDLPDPPCDDGPKGDQPGDDGMGADLAPPDDPNADPSEQPQKDPGAAMAQAVSNVIGAAQMAKMSGHPGSVPGEITEMVDKLLNPVVPWEVVLSQFMTEIAQEDYSYRRPNRRWDDPLLPSRTNEGALMELNWYLDVSGSIDTSMIERFFSEMIYVQSAFQPKAINIIQFDCAIQKETRLESEDSLTELQVIGRGGTDLSPVREHMEKTRPYAAIIFSDMECSPMEEIDIPVLWCVFNPDYDNKSWKHTPTFGQVLEIPPDKA